MKTGNRSNALLVELLIVVMFFMLASTVLLQVFAEAHRQSDRAELISGSLAEAQNIADRLYAADDAQAALAQLGFVCGDDHCMLEKGALQFEARIADEADAHGIFRRQEVLVKTEDGVLFTLPCSRWIGGAE